MYLCACALARLLAATYFISIFSLFWINVIVTLTQFFFSISLSFFQFSLAVAGCWFFILSPKHTMYLFVSHCVYLLLCVFRRTMWRSPCEISLFLSLNWQFLLSSIRSCFSSLSHAPLLPVSLSGSSFSPYLLLLSAHASVVVARRRMYTQTHTYRGVPLGFCAHFARFASKKSLSLSHTSTTCVPSVVVVTTHASVVSLPSKKKQIRI